jgi:hypothetical protein
MMNNISSPRVNEPIFNFFLCLFCGTTPSLHVPCCVGLILLHELKYTVYLRFFWVKYIVPVYFHY